MLRTKLFFYNRLRTAGTIPPLVGRLINKVTDFSQPQSSIQGGKTQAYRLYVEFFQRSNGGCSEEKCYLIYHAAH